MPSEWASMRGAAREDGDYNVEAFVPSEATLAGHLAEQMALLVADPRDRLIGQYLIDLVDETGYFTGTLDEVAAKLGAPLAQVEAVLKVLQTLDPSGVGARSLAECLAIQLKERDRYDPAMQALIAHLDLLAKRDLAALKRLCGVDEEDLLDMVSELRALDPKPGLAFGSAPVQPVIPDVFVRKAHDGSWLVELNSDTLPKVLVSQTYYAEVSKTVKNQSEKTYLADCLQSASWLVRALDQRAKTILKVATEIVRQQDGFLRLRCCAPQAAQSQDRGRSHQYARVDGVTRDREQIHGHQPRHLRVEIFLHLGDRVRRRWRGALGRSGATPHQAADRRRKHRGRSVRRYHRGQAARCRHRHCSPHRGEISRSNADSIVGSAPTGEAVVDRRALIEKDAALIRSGRSAPGVGDAGGRKRWPFGCRARISTSVRRCVPASASVSMSCSTRYFDRGYSGHATVGKEGFGFRTECAVHLDSGVVLHAEGLAADAYSSADQAALRIEKRLRRYRGRLKSHPRADECTRASPRSMRRAT